ncbi:hypothetical protein DVH24_019931 [Malus domestica]|uniref:Uncharacterized protein n=1 Tax=Malus domestica TaxID=3750 RepID=A0A498I7G7_MALDO|nr:hypothetical protein DVH24_019931 [Malus domestica]
MIHHVIKLNTTCNGESLLEKAYWCKYSNLNDEAFTIDKLEEYNERTSEEQLFNHEMTVVTLYSLSNMETDVVEHYLFQWQGLTIAQVLQENTRFKSLFDQLKYGPKAKAASIFFTNEGISAHYSRCPNIEGGKVSNLYKWEYAIISKEVLGALLEIITIIVEDELWVMHFDGQATALYVTEYEAFIMGFSTAREIGARKI